MGSRRLKVVQKFIARKPVHSRVQDEYDVDRSTVQDVKFQLSICMDQLCYRI